jgi:hypothetical protein
MATTVVAVLAVGVIGALTAAPVAAADGVTHAAGLHSAKKSSLTRLGHGTFWECPAKTTRLLVGVNHLVLHPGQTLKMYFVAKNDGTVACNYVAPHAGVVSGPTATTTALTVGPCGSMSFEIEGAHHRNVFPGLAAYSCPALGFASLAPGTDVEGSGTWDQTKGGGTTRVPPGSYTVVIHGNFSFPLTIDAH